MRFSACGLLTSLGYLTWRDQRRTVSGKILIALCLSLIGLMLSSSPDIVGIPFGLRLVARFIDIPNTVLVWLFIKSIMRDNFRLDALHIGLALLYCAMAWSLTANIVYPWLPFSRPMEVVLNIYALGLFLHLIVEVIRQRDDDLVEPRRRLRLMFVAAVVGLSAVAILSELMLSNIVGYGLDVFKVSIVLILTFSTHCWLLSVPDNHIAFKPTAATPVRQSTVYSNLTNKDRHHLSALNHAMTRDELWRDPDLIPDKLASHLSISPKRLRTLINQHLGDRNFRSFLQQYRLEAAKNALTDGTLRDISILEIALQSGFNSTSTFNRVFKDSVGISPKAYRAEHIRPE